MKPVEGGYLLDIPVSSIVPNAQQPRSVFDEEELNELAASIKEVGVLQPIVVRKRQAGESSKNDVSREHRRDTSSLWASVAGVHHNLHN